VGLEIASDALSAYGGREKARCPHGGGALSGTRRSGISIAPATPKRLCRSRHNAKLPALQRGFKNNVFQNFFFFLCTRIFFKKKKICTKRDNSRSTSNIHHVASDVMEPENPRK